jgi:hypothetical protein
MKKSKIRETSCAVTDKAIGNYNPPMPADNQVVSVKFFGRLEDVVRGPHIQGRYKKKYFASEALDVPVSIDLFDGRDASVEQIFNKGHWNHFLFPSDCVGAIAGRYNFSVGPNIPLSPIFGPEHPKFHKPILNDRWVVADSQWNKEALLECFPEISPDKVVVIPIYVGDHFRNTRMQPRDVFTVGCVGYPNDKANIKNLDAVLALARRRPEWRFELVVNRDHVPEVYNSIQNIRVFLDVENQNLALIMKKWSCYLGISKRERGPATIQEASTMGCPTVCSNHTGYACFRPLIPLKLPPFLPLEEPHIRYIEETLSMIAGNRQKFMAMAEKARATFWSLQTPEVITRSWKEFFRDRATEASGS